MEQQVHDVQEVQEAEIRLPSKHSSFTRRAECDLSEPARMQALRSLKAAVADAQLPTYFDDLHLYRFLKARNFDAARAEQMLRRHIRWRREFGVDELMESYTEPEALRDFYPGGWCGHDLQGNPVWFEASGRLDPQGIARAVSREELLRSRMLLCERFLQHKLPQAREKTGLPIYTCTFVLDMQGYGRQHLWRPALEVQGEILRLCEQNYPETMEASLIINAPSIFPLVFNLARPLLTAETQQKVKVLGRNCMQQLQQHVALDQLPRMCGGQWPDDGICAGGQVPERLFRRLRHPELLQQQAIGRLSKFSVELHAPPDWPQAFVQWEFATEDGELGFEIRHVESDSCLVSVPKVDCASCPAVGAVRCCGRGRHVATFDNSFSWLRAKKLQYCVRVVGRQPSCELLTDFESKDHHHHHRPGEAGNSLEEEEEEQGARAEEEFERDLDNLLRLSEEDNELQ